MAEEAWQKRCGRRGMAEEAWQKRHGRRGMAEEVWQTRHDRRGVAEQKHCVNFLPFAERDEFPSKNKVLLLLNCAPAPGSKITEYTSLIWKLSINPT